MNQTFTSQINDDGYHILHISPLGYTSPSSIDESGLLVNGKWPVLHNTAMGIAGGYEDRLIDCLLAIFWVNEHPKVIEDRISLLGTSQGGGASLLLGALFPAQFRCICADFPF